MRELATYSIETDQTVLLVFTDGQRARVPVNKLRDCLSPSDYEQVRGALKLRRHFLTHHMPKAALALAAGGLLAVFAMAGRPLALWWTGNSAPSDAEPRVTPASAIVRSLQDEPAPATIGPTPPTNGTPASSPAATPLAKRRVTRPLTRIARVILPTPGSPIALVPTPSPLPIVGEVLGDQTGPDDPTPTPAPTPAPTVTPLPSSSPMPSPAVPQA